MKYLVYILVLLFTSPAFAYDASSAFSGASGNNDELVIIEENPVTESEAGFEILEKLYRESIGSNTGYYGGGFYGEEKYAAQIGYYTISSNPSDFGFGTGLGVFNGLPIFSSGIFSGGTGFNGGSFSFGHGSIGFSHR